MSLNFGRSLNLSFLTLSYKGYKFACCSPGQRWGGVGSLRTHCLSRIRAQAGNLGPGGLKPLSLSPLSAALSL